MAREITGFSNPLVKRVRSLREKKYRKAEGLFLAEGLRILTEAREEGVLPDMLFHAGTAHPLGLELIDAVDKREVPLVQAITFLAAVLVIVMNTLADLAIIVLDPRVRSHARE